MIKIEFEGYDKLVKNFGYKLVERANGAAIRNTLAKTRTQIKKFVREDYTIKAGTVQSQSYIKRLSLSPPAYELGYTGNRLSMERFALGSRSIGRGKKKRRAITVRITKKRKVVKGGFAIRGYAAFRRKGRSRLPIEKRTTLAMPQMVNTKKNTRRTFKFMGDELPIQFARAMDYQLIRAGFR